MHRNPLRPLVLVSMATLALAACGGRNEDDGMADQPGQVPASVTGSVAAYTAYVGGLPASDSDEPLTLNGLLPPASDSDEPVAVR